MGLYSELPQRPRDSTGFDYAFVRTDARVSFDEVRTWCEEHFGPSLVHLPNAGRWFGHSLIWIRTRDDALLFKIRWC